MKIITRAVLEWDEELQRYATVEEEWFDYDGPLAECKKPKAPPPPDPTQVAGAQTQQNRDAALYSAALNRMNTYSPLGSQEFTQTGVDPATGAPITRQDIKLDPQTEQLFRQQQGTDLRLGEAAGGMIDRLPTSPFSLGGLPSRGSLNTEGLPEIPTNFDSLRKEQQDALYSRNTEYLDPQFQRGEESLRTRLANQGIVEGSEAYKNAVDDFNRGKETAYRQARNESIAGGGAEADRAFGMSSSARGQMFGEQATGADLADRQRAQALAEGLTERQLPYAELAAVRGMTGSAELPQFQGPAQVGVGPADIQGAIGQQYQGQMDAYNAKVQQRNALLGGLFGLGGAAILAR